MSATEPYHFVPIHPDLAVTDEPVFHDVQKCGPEFWSGELHCELECLTPLIAGNYQFEHRHVVSGLSGEFQKQIKAAFASQGESWPTDKQGKPLPIHDQKHWIEPFTRSRLGSPFPEQVLIPGTQLKGMLRQSLQALLSAPMERVAERTYSFRPNISIPSKQRRLDVVPVVVLGESNGMLIVQPLEPDSRNTAEPHSVVFLRPSELNAHAPIAAEHLSGDPQANFSQIWSQAVVPPTSCWRDTSEEHPVSKFDRGPKPIGNSNDNRFRKKLEKWEAWMACVANDYVILRYASGIDGNATFSRAFNPNHDGYNRVLARLPLTASPMQINGGVVSRFLRTLTHLADTKRGHLKAHPQVNGRETLERTKSNIESFLKLKRWVGYLMYLEIDSNTGEVVSLGHHFRYRWRYRDTIHEDHDPQRSSIRGQRADLARRPDVARLRSILCPAPLEVPREVDSRYPNAPRQLTAARALFGFVGAEKYAPDEPLTFGIGAGGKDDFNQLAGRIAFNWAAEVVPTDPKPDQRFLNAEKFCLVPLKPLGSPKASAVEVYLQQTALRGRTDGGTLCTYGDSLDDPAAGELNGRKFYLHQPDARSDPKSYELLPGSDDWVAVGNPPTYHILSQQSAVARFVSKPTTRFRFTIRFRDLREWELGALLFVLRADADVLRAFLVHLNLNNSPKLSHWLNATQAKVDADHPLLALKLGHGRPLGLGSVRVNVRSMKRLKFDTAITLGSTTPSLWPKVETLQDAALNSTQDTLVAKLATKLIQGQAAAWAEQVLLPWLKIHQYADRTHSNYQRANGLIYSYHTQERRDHAEGRKKNPPQGHRTPRGLKPL